MDPPRPTKPKPLAKLRSRLRSALRELVFRWHMRRFLRDPEACRDATHPRLARLVYGWANMHYSAREEFLAGCVAHALTTPGPILECGSGLSTVLLGAIAKRRRQRVWALEHHPDWDARVRRALDRYRLDSVVLCTAPLGRYGAYHWYAPPLEEMPERFSLVVCDGPPGNTKGGRYGMLPLMKDRLAPGCVILLDDAERPAELAIAERWAEELATSFVIVGTAKPYIEMKVPGGTADSAKE
jgi:predicted O-methyltransferase YrrM